MPVNRIFLRQSTVIINENACKQCNHMIFVNCFLNFLIELGRLQSVRCFVVHYLILYCFYFTLLFPFSHFLIAFVSFQVNGEVRIFVQASNCFHQRIGEVFSGIPYTVFIRSWSKAFVNFLRFSITNKLCMDELQSESIVFTRSILKTENKPIKFLVVCACVI